jgi:tetratricopeptide (TPR) repeat protein
MTGRTVLHYEIQERLGEGGMGVIYAARDLKLGRRVALKFLPPKLVGSPENLERLRLEAKAISALNHPHIEIIYDLHEADGQTFLVLEYLPGGTLKQKLVDLRAEGRRLSLSDVVRYAVETTQGLAHAHRLGILHCDVKTSNLMLTAEGAVKITDFGLAQLMHDTRGSDEPGTVKGTLAYMSPEQARGHDLDARADIFSFGVVLFELLTGRLPFDSPSETAMHPSFATTPAPRLREFRPEAPEELDRIVARSLEKRREDRYQDAGQMLKELRAVQDTLSRETEALTQAFDAASTGPLPAVKYWTRSAKAAVAGLALLALMILLAVAVPGVRQRLWGPRPSPLPAEQRLAVLPFRNIGNATSDAVCAGLMDILTSKLTQLEQFQGALRVFSASDVLRERVTSPREAQRAFGATLALDVSAHRDGERLILNANLVDTGTQLQVAAETMEVPAGDLGRAQESLTLAAVRMLNIKLRPEARQALKAGATQVPTAYEFYVQGRGYLQYYAKPENIDSAITVFERALKLDPNYALAYAGLGEARWLKYDRASNKVVKWVEAAEQDCQQAVRLNSSLPEAHICLGTLYNGRGQYEKAAQEFQRAADAEPANDDAYRGLALAQERLGKVQEAEDTYRRAIGLRPHYWASYNQLGLFFYHHGRYREAAEQWQRTAELTPDNSQAFYNLGAAYAQLERFEEAIAAFRKSTELRPTWAAYSNLGSVYMRLRRFEEAVSSYQEALKDARQNYRVYGYLARAYYWAPGKRDLARDLYEQALRLGAERLKINPKDTDALFLLARYSAMVGRRAEAFGYLRRGLQEPPGDPELLVYAAVVHNQFGERAAALDWLEKAAAKGYSPGQLRAEIELDNLREEPRFLALIKPK